MMGWKQVRQNGNGRVVPTFYSPANSANPHYITVVVDATERIIWSDKRGIPRYGN